MLADTNSELELSIVNLSDFAIQIDLKYEDDSLSKMQIMEDVREGSDVNPPSSPGHADECPTTNGSTVKEKDPTENGHGPDNGHVESRSEEIVEEVDEPAVKEETEEKEEKKSDEEIEDKLNDNCSNSSTESNKRKLETEETTPIKRLRPDVEDHFVSRDKILEDEITECHGMDQIMTYSEQILAEIKTLNDLAREKEREWNHLIYMKKLKEELLIRLQRKRQVLLLSESNLNEVPLDVIGQQSLLKSNQKSSVFKMTNFEKSIPSSILPKPSQMDINSALDFRQKQRPILDVQSIIADYRQRHPESVPRRGRRIRQSQGGEQKDGDYSSELGMILNQMNGNRNKLFVPEGFSENTPYKDLLVEFAKLSEKERDEVRTEIKNSYKPPPPYPEVTVHPVASTNNAGPTSSLLHGILTKSPTKHSSHHKNHSAASNLVQPGKTAHSPCLARLLTAPEKSAISHATSTPTMIGTDMTMQGNNMSLSEILSNTKARNEITITPVSGYESSTKTELEEDGEEGPDRLIIDESSDMIHNSSGKTDTSEIEEVPQCQGCNQKAALFVCAGCGNQWYCSRECQVDAWDEHSEVCSG